VDWIELIFKVALFAALSFVVFMLAAQFVCWGLSAMHVSTGLSGPMMILAGISMVAGTSARAGSRR